MTNSSSSEFNAFYSACLNNDLKQVRKTVTRSCIDQVDDDGNTALHIASSHGYTELVQLLFRYHASRKIKNKQSLIAEQVGINDEIKNLFKAQKRSEEDSKNFVGSINEVEWIDSYKNAYRIAYENREHMKRWLLKISFEKLLDEFDTGYIDKMEFANEKSREFIKDYLQLIRDFDQPAGFISIYSSGGTGFCTKLNYDLAEIGSDFRFLSTQNLFNSGYLDNEAPKNLGQHIFAAILMNHHFFRRYYHTGTTYRGMNITPGELAQYKENDIVLTRSFLSTSENPEVTELFRGNTDENKDESNNKKEKIPILCVYKVINGQTSLSIEEISTFKQEKEVLIVPFAVFRITKIENGDMTKRDKNDSVIIYLEEVDSNLL